VKSALQNQLQTPSRTGVARHALGPHGHERHGHNPESDAAPSVENGESVERVRSVATGIATSRRKPKPLWLDCPTPRDAA
jgi:hypothetical protein